MAERLALVVDDHSELRELMRDVLTDAGFRVVAAQDGLDALERLTHCRTPEVIVVDLMMPVMDGAELVQQVRLFPELREVPIVAVTALRPTGAARPPVDAVVRKPFEPDEFVQVVESAIAARHSPPPAA